MSPDAPARGVVADPALNARYRDLLRQSLPPSLAPMIPFFCDLTRLHTLAAAGFVATPRRLDPKPFMLVTLPLGEAAAFAPADWRFAWGDMDVA